MPQADGPGRPTPKKRVVKKKSVGDAISGATKKDVSFGVRPEQRAANKAKAKSHRVQRKVANEIASTKPMSPGALRRVGGEVQPLVAPKPFRLVDPVAPAAKKKAAKDEKSTVNQLQKVSDRARKDLNKRGGSKADFKKRDKAIETLKTVKDLPGTSKVDEYQAKYDAKMRRRRLKEQRDAKRRAEEAGKKANPRAASDPNPTPRLKRQGVLSGDAPVGFVGVDAIARRVKKSVGEAAHLIAPRGGKKAKSGTGRLASAGGANMVDLPNSAPGIVLRSTVSTAAQQPGRTALDIGKMGVSTVPGLARAALHPGSVPDALAKDFSHRYAPAVEGNYKKFHKRQMKEGAAPEVVDIGGAAVGAGGGAARIAQKVAEGGAVLKAAEGGSRVAQKVRHVATAERRVRYSGGEHGVRVQAPSKNFIRNATRHAVDHRRKVSQKKKAEAASGMADGAKVDAVVQAAHQSHEVRPALGPATREGKVPVAPKPKPEVALIRKGARSRAQRKAVAKTGGAYQAMLKAEQSHELLRGPDSTDKNIRSLSKAERGGWKYAAQYGITNAEQARAILPTLVDHIRSHRSALEAAGTPAKILVDEVPHIQQLIKNADQVFTPALNKAVRSEGKRSRRLARLDPALGEGQGLRRVYQPAGDLLGVEKVAGESAGQYAQRVRKAMVDFHAKTGTTPDAPAYFKSEQIPKFRHAVFAKGGRRAIREDGAYTGALTKTGRESWDTNILVRQGAQNIKRRYNWNIVGDTVDKHVLGWTKTRKWTAHALNQELISRGIDPSSVMLWNPRLMREAKKNASTGTVDIGDPTLIDRGVQSALEGSSGSLHDFATMPERFKGTGWQLLPTDAYHEVMGSVGQGSVEGVAGRSWDIAKGKVSRVLLANPAWLGFQVGSNALMAGLAGVTPADFVRAQKFWKELPADQRIAAEAVFGVHGWYNNQRHLGATADNGFVNAYRVLKETPFYRKASDLNPLDRLFFRPDNAQNNAFRRALMYNRLKREAYTRMGKDASAMMDGQQRITGMLAAGSREQVMRELVKNRDVLEQYAQHVDDFLGNWTTYTARERHYASRFVMFYGFLRFSTRLAFYTMPVKHPIVTSIGFQLGKLEKSELERIFGSAGAEPPPWEYGNFYGSDLGFGESPKPGQKVDRFSMVRLIPFFNAVTSSNPLDMANSLAFPITEAIALKTGQDSLGNAMSVDGKTTHVKNGKDLSGSNKAEIALADILKLSAFYRAYAAVKLPGKQGNDSSVVFPQPTKYKQPGKIAENKAEIQRVKKDQTGAVLNILAPLLGSDGSRVIKKSAEFKKSKVKTKAGRRVKPKAPYDPLGLNSSGASDSDPLGLSSGTSSDSDPLGLN